jgi:hypothetical protein
MNYRKLKVYTEREDLRVGPFHVKQPLPSGSLGAVSPFLLLHHSGPSVHAPGALKARLSPHPHRGFEPVTFVFNGSLHHKDSTGSEGFMSAGDVQWMTSGSGIIHSEGPSAQFAKEGGIMEIIQLWVNLPRDYKMTQPRYQDIKKENIPTWNENGFRLNLVAGTYNEHAGPAQTFSPITAMTTSFFNDAETTMDLPSGYNILVYVLDGSLQSAGERMEPFQLAVYENGTAPVQLKALSNGRALILAGEPIHEPVVSYGPFVMNYPGEIKQAILDYETGKMGVLES